MLIKSKIVITLGLFVLATIIFVIVNPHKITNRNSADILWSINDGNLIQLNNQGKVLSSLSSRKSVYDKKNNKVLFYDFTMEYYNSDASKPPTKIKSDEAISKGEEIELLENVIVSQDNKENNFKLLTSKAKYNTHEELFISQNQVNIYINDTHIKSDSAIFNRKKNRAEYHGNIIATKNDVKNNTKITADKMVNFFTKDNQLEKVIFYGNPAKYYSDNLKSHDKINAQAQIIEYNPVSTNIILKNNAIIKKNDDQMTSNYIFYNSTDGKISNKDKKNSRVTILFKPDSENINEKNFSPKN